MLTSIKADYLCYIHVFMKNGRWNPNLDLVNINAYANKVKCCSFLSKAIGRNKHLTSTKGHNLVTNLQKLTDKIFNLDLVNIYAYTKLCPFVLKILSWNEILTSIKADYLCYIHVFMKNGRWNPKLDLVNINAYANTDKCCSFLAKAIGRNKHLTSTKGHNYVTSLWKNSVHCQYQSIYTEFGLIYS